MAKAILEINAILPFTVRKKGKWFISSCPTLDVFSQGKTEKQAKENLKDALSLFFMSCLKRNTLDEVLQKCGFSVSKLLTEKPKPQTRNQTLSKNFVNVPLYLLSNQNLSATECHA
jgi:predicted RNase H-like HicB family nuclease